MAGAPILFTPRLILRLPEPQDFEAYAAFAADFETMAHLGGAMSRAAVWRDFSMFSVIERDTGTWVGRIGPWQPEGWPGTEVGWGVSPHFAGKGYALEAATAAIDYAVDVLGWDDVIHTIAPDNLRSIRLAERLGAANRGPTQLPPPLDHFRVDAWGQSAAAWRARRGQG